jgi:fructose 1,6-bisphosphate aldolase/phosphatase
MRGSKGVGSQESAPALKHHSNGARYIQSKDDLNGLPTVRGPDGLPNVFTLRNPHPRNHERFAFVHKADIGGVGGHIAPHPAVMATVAKFVMEHNDGQILSFFVSSTGDDIAISGVTPLGMNHPELHRLTWAAFEAGTEKARALGLYGPGQDLIAKNVMELTGNIQGAGPSVAEIPLDPDMKQSQVMFFYADKTDPGAYNLPFYRVFCDPMTHSALLLANSILHNGSIFVIQDVETRLLARDLGKNIEQVQGMGDFLIHLRMPEDLLKIATLLRDTDRYAIRAIFARNDDGSVGPQVASFSTSKLHNIAQAYVGKDDPVCIALAQKKYPAPGEYTAPWAEPFIVSGDCRGSHTGIIIPEPLYAPSTYSSGPIVNCLAVSIDFATGHIGGISDCFPKDTAWDEVRRIAAQRYFDLRRQGFFAPATLPLNTLEYGKWISQTLDFMRVHEFEFVKDTSEYFAKLQGREKVEAKSKAGRREKIAA